MGKKIDCFNEPSRLSDEGNTKLHWGMTKMIWTVLIMISYKTILSRSKSQIEQKGRVLRCLSEGYRKFLGGRDRTFMRLQYVVMLCCVLCVLVLRVCCAAFDDRTGHLWLQYLNLPAATYAALYRRYKEHCGTLPSFSTCGAGITIQISSDRHF
jgi:hypothetical protein